MPHTDTTASATVVLVERDPGTGSYSAYAAAVSRAFDERRIAHLLTGVHWTNPRIEACFALSNAEVNPVYWPTRVILHWAPEAGWRLLDHAGRTLHTLKLEVCAAPGAVAAAAAELLQTGAASYTVSQEWDGAAGLERALAAWQATTTAHSGADAA